MLFRFCLYGFLKNQQYYEAFWILAFRARGLSFAMIGLLIGFREICINVLEVPTGAVADVLGRRASMIFSHLAYIGSFSLMALFTSEWLGASVWPLFVAMLLFACGDAFRTGTHKAMIFAWLEHEGRADEKTRTYGYTRSWSKIGSALNVVLAATVVFVVEDYTWVFLMSLPPMAINIVNFLTYPVYLDGPRRSAKGMRHVLGALVVSVRDGLTRRRLRRLLGEAMAFEGLHKVTKDYLQPVVKVAALSLPLLVGLDDRRRTAVLIGAVYLLLHLVESYASRKSDAFSRRAGGDERGAKRLWFIDLLGFAGILAGVLTGRELIAVAAFMILALIQNLWRPILVSRVAQEADSRRMATVLSIESQAKALFAAVAAPLIGLAVDAMTPPLKFLPIAVVGLVITAAMLVLPRRQVEA